MPNPIKDLESTEEGILAVLSFNHTDYDTFVPWDAVVGLIMEDQTFAIAWTSTTVPEDEEPTRPTYTKLKVVR